VEKRILKLVIIFGVIFSIDFLQGNSAPVMFLRFSIDVLLYFAILLLLIIIWTLVTEIKVFQAFGMNRKKTGGKIGAHPCLKISYKDIEVSYSWPLNGGGIIFAHEFVPIVAQKIGKVGHVFEYCAGPGFIGFNLLANGLCDRLTLADSNPEAVEAIKETIKKNNLQDRVTVFQADCLDGIPESEQWDLVVSNPPWQLRTKNKKNIILCDPGGRVHEKFYRDINKFLKPDGSILFLEGGEYTNTNRFKGMIEKNGLRIKKSFRSASFLKIFKNMRKYRGQKITLMICLRVSLFFHEVYFIWSKRKGLIKG